MLTRQLWWVWKYMGSCPTSLVWIILVEQLPLLVWHVRDAAGCIWLSWYNCHRYSTHQYIVSWNFPLCCRFSQLSVTCCRSWRSQIRFWIKVHSRCLVSPENVIQGYTQFLHMQVLNMHFLFQLLFATTSSCTDSTIFSSHIQVSYTVWDRRFWDFIR